MNIWLPYVWLFSRPHKSRLQRSEVLGSNSTVSKRFFWFYVLKDYLIWRTLNSLRNSKQKLFAFLPYISVQIKNDCFTCFSFTPCALCFCTYIGTVLGSFKNFRHKNLACSSTMNGWHHYWVKPWLMETYSKHMALQMSLIHGTHTATYFNYRHSFISKNYIWGMPDVIWPG